MDKDYYKIREGFEAMTYDERQAIASTIEPQKEEVDQIEYEYAQDISLREEELRNDPLYNKRFSIGGRRVPITYFISIREGSWPDYFTVKQAKALNPRESFARHLIKGTKEYDHVPADSALDNLADEVGLTVDQVGERAMQIRYEQEAIEDMKRLLEETKERRLSVDRLTAIINDIDNPVDKQRIIERFKKDGTLPDFTTLVALHRQRNRRIKAADDRREHSKVIEFTQPEVIEWVKNPSSADVRNIDMPKTTKKTRRRATTPSLKLSR